MKQIYYNFKINWSMKVFVRDSLFDLVIIYNNMYICGWVGMTKIIAICSINVLNVFNNIL